MAPELFTPIHLRSLHILHVDTREPSQLNTTESNYSNFYLPWMVKLILIHLGQMRSSLEFVEVFPGLHSCSQPEASASGQILHLVQWWYNLGMLQRQNVREFHLERLFRCIDRASSFSFVSFNGRSSTAFWFDVIFYCFVKTFVHASILRIY